MRVCVHVEECVCVCVHVGECVCVHNYACMYMYEVLVDIGGREKE